MSDLATPLIELDELTGRMKTEDFLLLDTRDTHDYARAHIPGALSLSEIFYYLCTPENGGLPGLQAYFTRLFGEAGVTPDRPVVIYEDAMDNGYGRSCRGWLLMKYLGVDNVQVLHGGFQNWKAHKLPVSTEPGQSHPQPFTAAPRKGYFVTAQEVRAAIKNPEYVIVDCRDYAEWIGANSSPYGYDYCPRKGRIPNAVWIEWYRVMRRDHGISWLRPAEEVHELFESEGVTPDKKVIVYCFKGARASSVVIALLQSGYTNVSNYLGSWNEWSRDFTLPIEEGYPETE